MYFPIFFSFFLNLQFNNIIFFFLKKDRSRRYQEPGVAKGPQADSHRVEGNTGAAGREQGHRLLRQSHRSSMSPQPPTTQLPIYKSPPMAVLRSRSGERGEGEGAGEWENATGPYPQDHPSTAGSDPGQRKLHGRAQGTGKAFHHCPSQPAPCWTRDVQSHCKWLLSKHQPQGPGKRRVSVPYQTLTHGIW